MGRCTAVEILELEERVPSHCGPETMLRPDQRLPLLEEVWAALTESERRTISDRLNEKQHGGDEKVSDYGRMMLLQGG